MPDPKDGGVTPPPPDGGDTRDSSSQLPGGTGEVLEEDEAK